MTRVVITGSTRGIGYGLAREFLVRGCAVVVNGRAQASADRAVAALIQDQASGRPGQPVAERILGQPGDVGSFEQVQALWDAAVNRFGGVDVWVNNAGLATPTRRLWDHPPELVAEVVRVNLLGTMYGCQVAIRGMIDQGDGQIFNMEGFGSTDRMRLGMTVYGTTKRAGRYLSKSLLEETKDTPVLIGTPAPGMVVTDAILNNLDGSLDSPAQVRRVLNLLGERVETVAPFLVERMLANNRTGRHIAWLTKCRMVARVLLAPLRKRQIVDIHDSRLSETQ